MYPPKFGYVVPDSLQEALQFLSENEDARPLAGGHSLIPMLKLRIIRPSYLVDIRGLNELKGVRVEENHVRIGALTTHYELEKVRDIVDHSPLLSKAAMTVADPQVRNMGTIGGVVANSDPAADYPSVLAALGASVVLTSRKGERRVHFKDFQKDVFTTDLMQGELVKEIYVPILKGYSVTYKKLERRAGDYAIVGVAAASKTEGEKVVDVRIGLTAVGPTALRAYDAEKVLIDNKVSEDRINRAAEEAMKVARPTSDIRGSSQYKKEMVKVMVRRALVETLGLKQLVRTA